MNKIKNQLEAAIEKELNKLVSNHFEFKIEQTLVELTKIMFIGLSENNNFDDKIKNTESHFISLFGIVSAFEKSNNGSKSINLSFRQPNVEVQFDWAIEEFSIKDIEKFRFTRVN
jgi:hypothetical protein